MEILKSAEAFKQAGGTMKFSYVQLIVRHNGRLYCAKSSRRETFTDQLYDFELLVTESRGPKLEPSWTVLESPHDHYLKTPDLWAYSSPQLEQQILQEVEVCELLKIHPHPNIAYYSGCKSTSGRVAGLYFRRYTLTLLEKVNPGCLCKSDFISSGRACVDDPIRACLGGILAGIRHLHSLGIVHNDITPSNIMLDRDGNPVLIDFDSCRKVGEPLRRTKRTYGWHDPHIELALEKNDLDAFTELRTWLMGQSAEEFLFRGG